MSVTTVYAPGRVVRPARGRLLPLVAPAVGAVAAFGCPGCPCSPVDCESGACTCRCCCIDNYPLPAVAGLPVLEVV